MKVDKTIRKFLASIGKKGGKSRSKAKVAASRVNALKKHKV